MKKVLKFLNPLLLGLIEIPIGLFLIIAFSSLLTGSVYIKLAYVWDLNSGQTILYYFISSLGSNTIFTCFFKYFLNSDRRNTVTNNDPLNIKIDFSTIVIMFFVAIVGVFFNFRGIESEMKNTYRTCLIEKIAKVDQSENNKKECTKYLDDKYKDYFNRKINQNDSDR